MFGFDRQSVQRIQSAVLTVEGWRRTREPRRGRTRRGRFPTSQVVIATEDIEHNATGKAKIAEGTQWTGYLTATGDEIDVYNPGPKVWNGSRLLIDHGALRDSGESKWNIRQAWSATRIRGIATAQISPESTETINSITPLDGHYSPATASVYLPTKHITVQSQMVVWAELVYRTATSSSRWEVYSADCEAE